MPCAVSPATVNVSTNASGVTCGTVIVLLLMTVVVYVLLGGRCCLPVTSPDPSVAANPIESTAENAYHPPTRRSITGPRTYITRAPPAPGAPPSRLIAPTPHTWPSAGA